MFFLIVHFPKVKTLKTKFCKIKTLIQPFLFVHEHYYYEVVRDLMAFKKAINDKLEQLNNQKSTGIVELRTQFSKNFTKSLDHKSF